MPYDFKLPDLGEGITEAEIRKWLVREGDTVAEHQAVVEVETDKAVVEVPSPRTGRVTRLYRKEGEIVHVGEPLLALAEARETVAAPEAAAERPRSVGIVGVLPEAGEAVTAEILATPQVRALAREMGINLAEIRGTGPRGSITRDDLQAAAGPVEKPGSDDYGPVERLPLRGIRRTIARNLITSQQLTAFVTGMEEADVTDLWELKVREAQELSHREIHFTLLPVIIKAVQHALAEHPFLNASLDEQTEEIVLRKYCNIGIAVDTADGLMVPVLRDVGKKSALELAEELNRLGERARARTITLQELKGSTFTISNYGQFGGTYSTPIINYPDAAILGCGRVADRPWVVNGEIKVRKILHLSLTFDHRLTDGADATRFLAKVVRFLEDPALLFIEST
jgi:pyruvate dehydrogenase E2 component (dihydrolipoamide acetyltransferase)